MQKINIVRIRWIVEKEAGAPQFAAEQREGKTPRYPAMRRQTGLRDSTTPNPRLVRFSSASAQSSA